MGLFNRRSEPRAAAPAAATTNGHRRERNYGEPYPMQTRPTFGQWLKFTWQDILTMAVMGAIGLGVYFAKPAPDRSFAVTFNTDGEIVYPQFAYPMRKEIVPIWAAALLASLVPIFVIVAMQVRVRSFWDANNAIIGLFYALIGAAVFQVFVKWLIGGLRPHFLTVCQPNPELASNPGIAATGYNAKGYQDIYYTREICTGDQKEINDSLESMPSGHTTAAFAGFVFLYLYLNAKLKVFSNYHPAMWKLIAIYAPILGACLIGGALTIDEFHNWYDILAGAIIGTIFAFSSYRMCYASIWDWRNNHIPLHRNTPFIPNNHELSHAVFTRKAGWGDSVAGTYSGSHGEKNGHGLGHNGVGHDNGVVGSGSNAHGVGLNRKPVGTAPEHMV